MDATNAGQWQEEKPDPTPCEDCGDPVEPFYVERVTGFDMGGFWGPRRVCESCSENREKERARRERREALRRNIERACIPIRHAKAQIPLKQKLIEFLERFESDEDRPIRNGCFLTGPTGGGKTSQLASAGLWWIKHRPRLSVHYARETDVIDHLRDWDNKRPFDRYTRVDLLLLDELGIAKATEFTGERLGKLLDARYASLKPTIFASNWRPHQLADLVTKTRDGEHRNYDDRGVDRILEMCEGFILAFNTNHRRGQG